jgi:enterochelin esterase-like enzyme
MLAVMMLTLRALALSVAASAALLPATISLDGAGNAIAYSGAFWTQPGKRKIINIKLSRAGRAFVKPHRTVAATLTVVVSIGQTKTTITKHVKLKRR